MKNNLIKNITLGAILFAPATNLINEEKTSNVFANELLRGGTIDPVALQTAIDLVNAAEVAPTKENILAAREALRIIPESQEKTEQVTKLEGIALTEATRLVGVAEGNITTATLNQARNLVNILPEGADKIGLQTRLNALTQMDDLTFDRLNASANVDIYIECQNMLSLSLSTNQITFENFTATEDLEELGAVTLTVHSSLSYDVNAYLPVGIKNEAGDQEMDIRTLNIKSSDKVGSDHYQKFPEIGEGESARVVLLEDQPDGNGITHGIDINLTGGLAHEADIYKAVIKFEVVQK